MGFTTPRLPDFDLDEWRRRPHHRRLEPLVKDWGLNGFGTPEAIYLLYLVKIVIFVGAALLLIDATSDVGGLGNIGNWWADPIVYQKFVVWTLLWEILGLGCGSMPLTFRFLPPIGGVLYWLQPETMRLPPWPDRVPFSRGTRRTGLDVALYSIVLLAAVVLLFSGSAHGTPVGTVPSWPIWILLGSLALLGLRDKTAFLAARPEHYAVMLIVFLFPPTNLIFALKLCMLAMWWGAATSKLNRHFPYVVSVMISNTPWQRSKRIKRMLWRHYPDDMRPSRISELLAHGGTVVEFSVPLVLILSRGGWLTTAAVTIMVLFHVHITSTFPLGVPLEWNVFFIYSTIVVFGHYAGVGQSSLTSLGLAVLLVLLLAGLPILGNLRPDLVSFLPSMRYYAGNWATSVWLFRRDGTEERFDSHLVKPAPIVSKQLTRLYDAPTAELLLYKGLAFRAMHSHGRGLNGLLSRAVDDLSEYTPREGELVAGVALGWNFGEGHLHNARLLDAVQFECDFTPGQLRVITLESQPFNRPTQRYQILDAATGLVEEGTVRVSDLLDRQPWESADDVPLPVEISFPPNRVEPGPSPAVAPPVPAAPAAAPAADAEPVVAFGPRSRPRPRPAPAAVVAMGRTPAPESAAAPPSPAAVPAPPPAAVPTPPPAAVPAPPPAAVPSPPPAASPPSRATPPPPPAAAPPHRPPVRVTARPPRTPAARISPPPPAARPPVAPPPPPAPEPRPSPWPQRNAKIAKSA
jgi:Transmembrane protein of unknown function (DUF3556)